MIIYLDIDTNIQYNFQNVEDGRWLLVASPKLNDQLPRNSDSGTPIPPCRVSDEILHTNILLSAKLLP